MDSGNTVGFTDKYKIMKGLIMARKKYKLIRFKDIREEIVSVDGSNTDYITPSGRVFKKFEEDGYYEKKVNINKVNGYGYCSITMINGRNKSHRVHILVAKAFVPNPDNLPIVGHRNNIKHDNNVQNLYWTTVSENTKKAYDDGLAVNSKGYDDSQSNPVFVYDIKENLLYDFGSVSECAKELNISKSTISKQCKEKSKSSRCGYIFKYQQ